MTTLFAASMGPPSFGGGNSTGTVLYLRMKLRLQWGHRLSAVETRLVPWSHRRTLTRFNGATVFRRWKRPQRPICELKGGSFNGATVFRRWKPGGFVNSSSGNLSLQWGHRLSAVETVTMQETLHGPIDWLQWGHRLSAVETLRYFFSSIECNAASMGPPSFGGGNPVCWRLLYRGDSCFNGATVFRRWKHIGCWCSTNGLVGFNGATVFRRWKRAPATYIPQQQFCASMGPPSFGGGNHTSAVSVTTFPTASMGPPSFGGGNFPVLHHRRSSSSLQWGHRLSAVETGLSLSFIRLEVSRFNGATVFRRWKPARRVCRSV